MALLAIGVALLALGGVMAQAEWVVPPMPESVGVIETLPADRRVGNMGTPLAASAEATATPSSVAPPAKPNWPIDPVAERGTFATSAPTAEQLELSRSTALLLQERHVLSDAPTVTTPTLTLTPTETPPPAPTPTPTATLTTLPTDTPPPTPTPEPRIPPAQQPPTHLAIPAIKVNAKVVPVGQVEVKREGQRVLEWQVADHAAGWHNTSQLPGHGGNVVIAGHNNMRGEVFRNLSKLTVGDRVTLYADDREYVYVVESSFVLPEVGQPPAVLAENARWIEPFPDERVTLVSCWPYATYTHRVIVIAKPTW